MTPDLAEQPLVIDSLRGGLNDSDPDLDVDSSQVADNVEYVTSPLGERRLGCMTISLPASITGDANLDAVTWMGRHLPTNNSGDAEFWALAQSLTTNYKVLVRRTKTGWSVIAPIDAINATVPYGHRVNEQTLHAKFFLAYKSSVDRLHVWDGTQLRPSGLSEPVAPSVADSVPGGTYTIKRYFRVRYVALNTDGIVLRRSEPSVETSLTPSGAKDGAVVSRPALLGEGETHWEVEASLNNADYFRVQRVVIATLTYTDTTDGTTGYDILPDAVLSEDIGDYTLVPSGEFLSIDDDRLLIAGSFENDAYSSRVWWTPVNADPGVGNDERVNLNANPFVDLDGVEGGAITGLSQGVTGYVFVFKRSRIYKLIRTNELDHAYEPICITRVWGALRGSLVAAADQAGQPCLYFLDPSIGPARLGSRGLEWCGYDVQNNWADVVADATVPCHGRYYPTKQQVHWWVATNGASYPNTKIILHVNRSRITANGVRKGWVKVPVGDRIAAAHCSTMFSLNIDSTDPRSIKQVPFIGLQKWSVAGTTIRNLIQRCDVGYTDGFTTGDDAAYYRAKVRTRPYMLRGLLNMFGTLVMSLLAQASDGARPVVRFIRNYGREDAMDYPFDLTPEGRENRVIRTVDDLKMSELTCLEVEFGDLDVAEQYDKPWNIYQIEIKPSGDASA